MKMKDIVVGDYYAWKPSSYDTRMRKALVVAIGDTNVPYQKVKGVTIQVANQTGTRVVASRELQGQWAPYEERLQAQQAHAEAVRRFVSLCRAEEDGVRDSLASAGLDNTVVTVNYNVRQAALVIKCTEYKDVVLLAQLLRDGLERQAER